MHNCGFETGARGGAELIPNQCIPGRIQHLLAAVPIVLSRSFAQQHDEAISSAVAAILDIGELNERDKLLMQRKISKHGLGLKSMGKKWSFFSLQASLSQSRR